MPLLSLLSLLACDPTPTDLLPCVQQISPGRNEVGDISLDQLFPNGELSTTLNSQTLDGEPVEIALTATPIGEPAVVELFDCPANLADLSLLRVQANIRYRTPDGAFEGEWTGPVDFQSPDRSQLIALGSFPVDPSWYAPRIYPHDKRGAVRISGGSMQLQLCNTGFSGTGLCEPIFVYP